MRFTDQLRQLNASVTSAQKAARYALKYRDMAEDLHSCILEQLERVWALSFLSTHGGASGDPSPADPSSERLPWLTTGLQRTP